MISSIVLWVSESLFSSSSSAKREPPMASISSKKIYSFAYLSEWLYNASTLRSSESEDFTNHSGTLTCVFVCKLASYSITKRRENLPMARMKQASVRLATALAVRVFPVPGGPYSSTPREWLGETTLTFGGIDTEIDESLGMENGNFHDFSQQLEGLCCTTDIVVGDIGLVLDLHHADRGINGFLQRHLRKEMNKHRKWRELHSRSSSFYIQRWTYHRSRWLLDYRPQYRRQRGFCSIPRHILSSFQYSQHSLFCCTWSRWIVCIGQPTASVALGERSLIRLKETCEQFLHLVASSTDLLGLGLCLFPRNLDES